MGETQTGPRITPVEGDEITEPIAEALATAGIFADNTVFKTVVRHPKLFKRLMPWGTHLLYGKVPERERELLILRTANLCNCTYELGHHNQIALTRGVTADDVAAVPEGPEHPIWSPFDAALLRAVDELHFDAKISDATWAKLSETYDDLLMIELLFLIGHYHMMAGVLNSLGVELEPEYLESGGKIDL